LPASPARISLDRCHVLILAAGRGTRMGGPKALMLANGRPWWQIQHSRVQALGIPTTWVVSEAVKKVVLVGAGTAGPPRMVVANDGLPMFSSLVAGLRLLSGPDGVFVLPVDTPASTNRANWEALAAPGKVSIPTFQSKKGHPVFLPKAWVVSTVKLAQQTPDPNALRLDQIISPLAALVPVDDPDVVTNLNSPEDLARYQASV